MVGQLDKYDVMLMTTMRPTTQYKCTLWTPVVT